MATDEFLAEGEAAGNMRLPERCGLQEWKRQIRIGSTQVPALTYRGGT